MPEFFTKKFLISSLSAVAIGTAATAYAMSPGEGDTEALLKERLPATEITAIDCETIDGLCEVQAKQNLFYVDKGARYLVIGRVYDMETKQDLTAARLLDMNPDMLLGGAAASKGAASPQAAPTRQAPGASKVDVAELTSLPASGAIQTGRGRETITVFSDFRCGYCKRLNETLESMNVKVVERPISILGTRSISEAVVCATDPKKAVSQAYNGEPIRGGAGECDTSGLDANEAFARKNGFTGTPIIVRSDGAVVQGYRPRDFLENWLKKEGA